MEEMEEMKQALKQVPIRNTFSVLCPSSLIRRSGLGQQIFEPVQERSAGPGRL
jgi:hypothetical protein